MTMTTGTWQKEANSATDQWRRPCGGHDYALITQYATSASYCWQAVRGGYRISGIVEGRTTAMAVADDIMALPIDEYNAIVAADLRADLLAIEKKILALQPDTALLPGFHAGYEAGVEDTKRKIAALLS